MISSFSAKMTIIPVLVLLELCIVGYDSYLVLKLLNYDVTADGSSPEPASANLENITEPKPLILTHLLKKNKIKEAHDAAEVKLPQLSNVKSFAGYFEVDEKLKSNTFFWFFEASDNPTKAPVVLWLNGGPGAASMFGLFKEHGPIQLDKDGKVTLRPITWAKTMSMLYIDNPAGTGFSFTSSPKGYLKTSDEVAEQLYNAITQFYQVFHELLENEFYIATESYGGKYGPSLASKLHKEIKAGKCKIKLSGLSIGNGLIDPVNMLDYGSFLYETGLFDSKGKSDADKARDEVVAAIEKKDLVGGVTVFLNFMWSMRNITQLPNLYNFLNDESVSNIMHDVMAYFRKEEVRVAIHVGNIPYVDLNRDIYNNFAEHDWMKSTGALVGELLEADYKVLIYGGHLDAVVPYPLTMSFLEHLQWKGADAYKKVKREAWMVDGKVVGYVKVAEKLTDVMIRNAGHFVPTDQPQTAFDMINKFVFNQPFF